MKRSMRLVLGVLGGIAVACSGVNDTTSLGEPSERQQAVGGSKTKGNGASTFPFEGARLRLDQARYQDGDCVTAVVYDADQNTSPGSVESLSIWLAGSDPHQGTPEDIEQVTLWETDADSGVFETSRCLPLTANGKSYKAGDSRLTMTPGHLLVGVYADPDNPGKPQDMMDVDVAVDLALISGGQPQGLVRFEIVPELMAGQPKSSPGIASGESERPLAMVLGPDGTPTRIGEDQLVYRPLDSIDRASFLQTRKVNAVERIPLGEVSGDEPVHELFRVDLDVQDTKDLLYLAELFGNRGTFRVSSKRTLALLALALEEQLGGRMVVPNALAFPAALPRTDEAPSGNGFNPWYMERFGVREAALHLDLLDRNEAHSVNVAVVDAGFASPRDYGNGFENPDFGSPFAAIAQGDCGTPGCSGSAAGPNPLPCAGGTGGGCDWHGTSVFGVIGAVADNSSGSMGLAGHAREKDGTDGESGLATPMFLRMAFPYMTTIARGVDAATQRGAHITNVSNGFACKPLLGLNLCNDHVRRATSVFCFAIGGILGSVVPGLREVIQIVGCGGLEAIMHLAGFADEDLLRDAVDRAASNGVVVVASGPEVITLPVLGEFGPFDALDKQMVPCVYPSALCVGWADFSELPHPDNPLGSGIDLWAPGDAIETTPRPGSTGTAFFSGTSAAAPFVSGVVTMMKAADPTLNPAQIRGILQRTSRGYAASVVQGSCVSHPRAGGCVGLVDAFAAVQAASGESLSCTGFEADVGDESRTAARVSLDPIEDSVVSLAGSIHALPDDQDWFRFFPPSLGAESTTIGISLSEGDPRFGQLDAELYWVKNGVPELLASAPAPFGLPTAALFTNEEYMVRIHVENDIATNDNCYEALDFRVGAPGVSADRHEPNDSEASAQPFSEQWVKVLDHDPYIFEHEVQVPVQPGTPGWASQDRWRLRIEDLSLHTQTDADFYTFTLPDSTDPTQGGYDDVDPDNGPDEPLDECTTMLRRGKPATVNDTLTTVGTVMISLRRSGGLTTEPLAVVNLPSTGGVSTRFVECVGRQPVVFSIGDALVERAASLGYSLEIEYMVDIRRDYSQRPTWPVPPPTPCRHGFSICPEWIVDMTRIERMYPFDPNDPYPFDPEGPCPTDDCADLLGISWDKGGPLDLTITSEPGLEFALLDKEGNPLGETMALDASDDQQRIRLFASDLPQGEYQLSVSGSPGRYTIEPSGMLCDEGACDPFDGKPY